MKHSQRFAIVVIFLGIIGFTALLRGPRVQTYRDVDLLALLASGACFGAGVTALVMGRRKY